MTETAADVPVISLEQWEQLGEEHYGEDRDQWEFVCPLCGHVQTVEGIMERKSDYLDLDDVRRWVFENCEGRFNEEIKCEWTLGWISEECGLIIKDGDDTKRMFAFPDPVMESIQNEQ